MCLGRKARWVGDGVVCVQVLAVACIQAESLINKQMLIFWSRLESFYHLFMFPHVSLGVIGLSHCFGYKPPNFDNYISASLPHYHSALFTRAPGHTFLIFFRNHSIKFKFWNTFFLGQTLHKIVTKFSLGLIYSKERRLKGVECQLPGFCWLLYPLLSLTCGFCSYSTMQVSWQILYRMTITDPCP